MTLFGTLQDRVLIAVPKKGRLYEPTMELLKGADIKFNRKNRLDIAVCSDLNAAIVFLPASDIPSFVGMGNVDLGITGQDVIAESGVDVQECFELGYGKCRLQVQVPVDGPLRSLEDLAGKRIVTSFENITNKLVKEHFSDGSLTKVTYVGGSVEAACSLGLADAIVDLVESGDTMTAAGLHPIYTVLTSQAVLIKNKAQTTRDKSQLIDMIESRLRGILMAQKHYIVKYNVERSKLKEATRITPGNRAPSVIALEEDGWVAVEAMIVKSKAANILDELKQVGASDILLFEINNCRC